MAESKKGIYKIILSGGRAAIILLAKAKIHTIHRIKRLKYDIS